CRHRATGLSVPATIGDSLPPATWNNYTPARAHAKRFTLLIPSGIAEPYPLSFIGWCLVCLEYTCMITVFLDNVFYTITPI
ncbi:hypothetical protein K0M31_001188, partial [Melipona bicolor]